MHTSPDRKTRTTAFALLAIATVTLGTLTAGAGTAAASARTTAAGTAAPCRWAGTSHPQGATISAGGQNFRCSTDRGAPFWSRGSATDQPSSVPNPGAHTDPTGLFSAGARQPGTAYTDHCVGNQLIEGNEDIYQVVANRDGTVRWHAAAPISQWTFDPGATRPGPS